MYIKKYRFNKYGNIKTNGFDSKFEADKNQELELLKKAGEIKDFETQKRIPIYFKGELITNYKIDFVIYHNDGVTEYVETKGYMDYASNLRWKLFCAEMNDKPLTICTLEMQGKIKRKKSNNFYKK